MSNTVTAADREHQRAVRRAKIAARRRGRRGDAVKARRQVRAARRSVAA